MSTSQPASAPPSTLSPQTAFVRYARHLRASAPRLRIKRDLLLDLDGLVRDLRGGEEVSSHYGLWDEIVLGLACEGAGSGHPTCGRALLQFAGYLGDALREFGARSVPLGFAVALMMEVEPEPQLFHYVTVGERTGAETTPAGVARLGGAARFPLPRLPRGDGPHDLLLNLFAAG